MKEIAVPSKTKDYFRKSDTVLAKTLHKLAPEKGAEWRQSKKKRAIETMAAIPLYTASLPVAIGIRTAIRVTEGMSGVYTQTRVGSDLKDSLFINKIRTMYPGSDTPEKFGTASKQDADGKQILDKDDDRVTPIGKVIRPYELDELPQLFEVILGKLSLVGFRATHRIDYEALRKQRETSGVDPKDPTKNDFSKWEKGYAAGRPALFNPQAAFDPNRKEDNRRRYHYEMFYARNASLGLDLYILYRNIKRLLKKK